jgi:hypothetical protein
VLGNSRFQSSWLTPLWLVSCCLLLPAQIHKVDPGKTVTLPIAGATAAYTLDGFLAEASAENGLVSVVGIHSGSTHVVVLTPSGVQTLEFLITVLPPFTPKGLFSPSADWGRNKPATSKRATTPVPPRYRPSSTFSK